MQLPFGVIDADGHIIEDQARIRDYMPEPYNGFLMDNLPDSQGRVGHGSAITNRAFSDSTLGGRMGGLGPAGYPFPKDWLDALGLGRHGDDIPFSDRTPNLRHHMGPRLPQSPHLRLQLLDSRRMAQRQPQAQGCLPRPPHRRRGWH